MAEILGYCLPEKTEVNEDSKRPDQVFLGLEPGQLVSLADKKVFVIFNVL
jgi:hypothetical protein